MLSIGGCLRHIFLISVDACSSRPFYTCIPGHLGIGNIQIVGRRILTVWFLPSFFSKEQK